jgi:hypothetical protein
VRFLYLILATAILIAAQTDAQQTFTGRLSDSKCGASHQSKAATDSDRQCLLACITALEKYVLVDRDNRVIPIANQDAMGLPLYAGRPVRIGGDMRDGAVFVAKVEAIPAHLHIGHVMTNWRDTPGGRGFLPVAMDEARVAIEHARLAAKSLSLEDMQLHAGHVLHALDPEVVSTGPGAGYGVKKAAANAAQHLEMARTAEGATLNLTTHIPAALSSLSNVVKAVERAIATGQSIRSASNADEGTLLAANLVIQVEQIGVEGLQEAAAQMSQVLKAEGLLGAPR